MNNLVETLIRGIFVGIVCEIFRIYYVKWRKSKNSTIAAEENSVLAEKTVRDLLDANLTARDKFIHALAAFLMTKLEEEYPAILRDLATSIHFSRVKPNYNIHILQSLVQTEQFQRHIAAQKELAEFLPLDDSLKESATELLLNVHETATKLIVTRDALAFYLRFDKSSRTWDLRGQFLAAAFLHNSRSWLSRGTFASADFRNAILIGTHLEWTDLSGANFENAVMIYAQMTAANLTSASFRNANLTNAKLTNTEMTNADLTGAKVAWSTLYLAKNVDKSWQDADYEGEHGRDNKLWRRMKAKFGTTPSG